MRFSVGSFCKVFRSEGISKYEVAHSFCFLTIGSGVSRCALSKREKRSREEQATEALTVCYGLAGLIFQISLAYSWIVLSLEKAPE